MRWILRASSRSGDDVALVWGNDLLPRSAAIPSHPILPRTVCDILGGVSVRGPTTATTSMSISMMCSASPPCLGHDRLLYLPDLVRAFAPGGRWQGYLRCYLPQEPPLKTTNSPTLRGRTSAPSPLLDWPVTSYPAPRAWNQRLRLCVHTGVDPFCWDPLGSFSPLEPVRPGYNHGWSGSMPSPKTSGELGPPDPAPPCR